MPIISKTRVLVFLGHFMVLEDEAPFLNTRTVILNWGFRGPLVGQRDCSTGSELLLSRC